MDRRAFFKNIAGKATEVAVKHADERVNARAAHWIRPPFAIAELDFLLACTRCGDCVSACSYGVVFPLSARLGAQYTGTPALDLLSKGCHLCETWPCVNACQAGALSFPDTEENSKQVSFPDIADAHIKTDVCLPYNGPECGACRDSCPVAGALLWELEKPVINDESCVGCALCREACILEPKAIAITSRYKTTE